MTKYGMAIFATLLMACLVVAAVWNSVVLSNTHQVLTTQQSQWN